MRRRNKKLTSKKFIIPKEPEGHTFGKHDTGRKTMVMIDHIIHDLVPTELTIKDIIRLPFKDVPHVRVLNPIPVMTEEEAEEEELERERMHRLSQDAERENGKGGKVTSLRKAAMVGANVPEEIEKLLKEKKAAQEKGDGARCRAIRKQLRKLDYKRFEEQGVAETTSRKDRKKKERAERKRKRKKRR